MTSIVRSTHNVPTHAWATPTNGCLPTNMFPNYSDEMHRGSKFGNPACAPPATLTAACLAPPHRQPPLRIYGGSAEVLRPDIDDNEVPCAEEQMHKLMKHANPITTASQLFSRIRQAPIDNQLSSSPARLHCVSGQTVHVPSASWLPASSVPVSVHSSCLTAGPPGQSQPPRNRHADEYMTVPRHGQKRKVSSSRPQLDCMCTGLHSQSQEQLLSNVADHAVPLWQDDMAFGAELTQRPKRSAHLCFAQLQEFDRMHSEANGLAIGPLEIPRGTARPALNNGAGLPNDPGQALPQHDDSPALSVQGQSWPYACNPEVATEVSSGVKSLVSSHVSSQQSSYFSGSQQQPLFLTTFDMPLEAPPPPGLRPFYGHPWLWPQPQGSGPSTDCSRPQHGDTAPGQQLAALGQQSLTMTWPS